jgi:fatty acid desaturase
MQDFLSHPNQLENNLERDSDVKLAPDQRHQHECLHGHAFLSPKLNQLFGKLHSIFMMGSHSHNRYDHLRHHAYSGTSQNKEHFGCHFQSLDSLLGLALAFSNLSRYVGASHFIVPTESENLFHH